MSLTDMKCRNAKPGLALRKLSDGGGLQLWVQPTGARLWRFAYRFGGKQKLLALGVYPATSLADARQGRNDAKQILVSGVDPSQAKKQAKANQNALGATFRGIAEDYVSKLKQEGRADRTIAKIEWLLSFAYPMIGNHPIREIGAPDILRVLREVEVRGRHESARRLRSTIGSVFRYAVATARTEADPTLALKGALIKPTVTPRPAVTDPKALGALLRAIDSFDGQPSTQAALKLMALLFPRPGELRAAEWKEFNFDNKVWTIPATHTKMRRTHRIPLPAQAVAILKELHHITGRGVILFPGMRRRFSCIASLRRKI